MTNLKIVLQCPTDACNHTVQLMPSPVAIAYYEAVCGGCGTAHQVIALSPDELAWHDARVAAAVAADKPKEAAKK